MPRTSSSNLVRLPGTPTSHRALSGFRRESNRPEPRQAGLAEQGRGKYWAAPNACWDLPSPLPSPLEVGRPKLMLYVLLVRKSMVLVVRVVLSTATAFVGTLVGKKSAVWCTQVPFRTFLAVSRRRLYVPVQVFRCPDPQAPARTSAYEYRTYYILISTSVDVRRALYV